MLHIFLAVLLFSIPSFALPGDIDCDGDVDFDDFFILADDFGKTGRPECGGCPCGILVNEADTSLTISPIENLSITIVSPVEGDTLPPDPGIIASGTVNNLPSGYALRILVNPPRARWYPQHAPVIRSNNEWRGTIFVGIDEDAGTGKEFLIGVVALPEEEAKKLDKDLSGNTSYTVSGQFHADVLVFR